MEDRLLHAARRTLLPQAFPQRRDVEIAGGVSASDGEFTFFYDHFWPRPGCLALLAARVPGGGLESALRAAGLRHLLRAALVTADTPAAAVALCRDGLTKPATDLAVAVLDVANGALASATNGLAVCGRPGDAATGAGAEPLTADSLFWLGAGISAPPSGGSTTDDPQDLVRDALANAAQASVILLSYKLPTRRGRHETLRLANDLADIPRVMVAFEEFCNRQGIADAAVPGVNVALDEVLTNVVSYAFEDGAAHEIYIELEAQDQRLIIDVKDDGRPFDPLSAAGPELSDDIDERPIGGLGIHFVRSILDKVSYRRSDGWNVMTMEKALSSPESNA